LASLFSEVCSADWFESEWSEVVSGCELQRIASPPLLLSVRNSLVLFAVRFMSKQFIKQCESSKSSHAHADKQGHRHTLKAVLVAAAAKDKAEKKAGNTAAKVIAASASSSGTKKARKGAASTSVSVSADTGASGADFSSDEIELIESAEFWAESYANDESCCDTDDEEREHAREAARGRK
jgi:hypothetical protein